MKYIFVQIASYRDRDVARTVEDCIKKADNPRRLRFGICWQKDSDDESLLKYQSKDNFSILTFPYQDSKGVCWARNKIQSLYNGEDFIMQIDAHHRFVQDWDKILLKMNNNKLKSNYYVSAIINSIYLVLIIPAIFMMNSGLFCKYYSIIFFLIYLFSYKIVNERTK